MCAFLMQFSYINADFLLNFIKYVCNKYLEIFQISYEMEGTLHLFSVQFSNS